MNQRIFFIIASWLTGSLDLSGYDIPGFPPDEVTPYKETTDSSGGVVTLHLHIFNPEEHRASDSRPAIVLFFGGGWNSGSPGQFHPHCEYLASRGMVAISAEYRVNGEHGTSPQECVKDGKSAIRWVRQNASSLGIDPNRIAAGGGSAGGHVAAAAGTLTSFEEAGEDLSVSSRPNALVLYNPVYDNGPAGYGHSRVQAYWEEFSPFHNIDENTPPTAVFLGSNDALIPVSTAQDFQALMEAEGVRSDLHLYQDQPHSFFNYDIPDDTRGPYYGYQDTVFKTDEFLVSLGFLDAVDLLPGPVSGWLTIFGSSGLLNGSEDSASPVVTIAEAVAIAAAIPEIDLEDGDYIRLTGSVVFDVPLPANGFRLGFFSGDANVAEGFGSGYRGVWGGVPGMVSSEIREEDGTGGLHPFELASGATLGPLPGASAQLSANSPVDFSLMVARNGERFDITTSFDNGADYRVSQNLLNKVLIESTFDRVAFFMAEELDGSRAQFSGLAITTGKLASGPVPEPPIEPSSREITYVDAVAGASGNTFATGAGAADLSWLVNPGTSSVNESQWELRSFGNGMTLFQALHHLPDTIPELTTRISGLDSGRYEVWSFYWDQVESASQNWTLSTGLASGQLGSYSSPNEPAVPDAATAQVFNANELSFTNEVLTIDGGGLRNLFGVNLGTITVGDDGFIDIFTDNLLGRGSLNRTWFDGVGYARVNTYEAWIASFDVGGQTALSDDPDRDGVENGIESLYGTNPSLAGGEKLKVSRSDIPNEIVLTHPQSGQVPEGLLVQYQWSTDLVRFYEGEQVAEGGASVIFETRRNFPEEGMTTVTATLTGSDLAGTLYLRIAVSQEAP